MKSGFKDPIKIKNQKPENKPVQTNYPSCDYDERTSVFVNTGTNYGVGHRNPVGHKSDPKMRVETLPFGRVETMKVSGL